MSRVVFQLSAFGEEGATTPLVRLVEPVDDQALDRTFDCPADGPVSAQALDADVNAREGDRLFQALAAHEQLGDQLAVALHSADRRFPVYAEILPRSGADSLPWEALRFPGDGPYLALEDKYALARVVRTTAPPVPLYQLEPPLRIMALLSCLGLGAAAELRELRAAALEAGPGMARLLVVVSEEELATSLQAEVDAGTAPEIAGVHLVPPDHHDLVTLVGEFKPHVLHLFCHGSTEPVPHVRLALKQDWASPTPGIGLALEKEQFAKFVWDTDGGPWLVVLNCCEGAASSGDGATSLARDLVTKGVAPAAVGMREPIRSAVASTLTQGLYGALLGELTTRTKAGATLSAPLDWAALTVAARNRLVTELGAGLSPTQARNQGREWTLPALYLRWEEFQLQLTPARDDGAARVDPEQARTWRLEVAALQSLLAALPPGQGAAFRAGATERIAELAALLGVTPEALAEPS
ncbi:CHAT domain-containing protein [Promicromonospora sp. NPDC059942]|uniref:CHAT domain-containing protein n=1 Tax=Promicromonospora sp. NPDC059942 TaxID=3347009 RepID=UPI0036652BD1